MRKISPKESLIASPAISIIPQILLAPRAYPPVFPFLLVPVYLVSGLDFQAMKLIPIAFFLLSLYAIYLNFRTKLSFYSVLAIIAIIGLNCFFWNFKDNILSDLPFLFFTYSFFLFS